MADYKEIAKQARIKVLNLIFRAQTSHIGSNFSCIDILTVVFDKLDLNKDKFILSKGWAAASLYYFLWRKGRITEDELNSYCKECHYCKGLGCNFCNHSGQSKFIGLAEPIIPEIPFAGGSMGMGLPAAVGFALAKKLKGEEGTVYCLVSDGELQIGTTWEASLIAAQHELDNLVLIIDNNGLQAMGSTKDILDLGNIHQKLRELGYDSYRTDGHAYEDLDLIHRVNRNGKPLAFIADTIKGKGVSFMEDDNLYHYKQLSEEEYNKALKELNG